MHIFAFLSVYVMSEEFGERETTQQVWQVGLVAVRGDAQLRVMIYRCQRYKVLHTEEGQRETLLQQPQSGNFGHRTLK